MPKIAYTHQTFQGKSLSLIETANRILEDYGARGYDLTLRQLYYQFVARGILPNKDTEYKRLGSIINDARMCGLIDWDHINDRTRNLQRLSTWNSPADIVKACVTQYRIDRWADQPNYVEVWVEKDALVGVVQVPAEEYRVPYFACRGYTSQSEMWGAAMRLVNRLKDGKDITIIHLGDHDPSGIDMTRDIRDRLTTFIRRHSSRSHVLEVDRIALNMDQIEQYTPPPNPAKLTDSRVQDYIANYGDQSWELDALDPDVMGGMIRDRITSLLDMDAWEASSAVEKRHIQRLEDAAIFMWHQPDGDPDGDLDGNGADEDDE